MTYKLSILGSIFLLGGTAIVVWLFLRILMSLRARAGSTVFSRRRVPLIRIGMLALGASLVLISQLIFWFSTNLEAFSPVDPSKPIAIIDFTQPEDSDPIMSLAIRVSDSGHMIPAEVVMRTDAASLEVEILRFPAWFRIMDVSDSYRISSVRFVGAESEPQGSVWEKRFHTDVERFWSIINAIGRHIPGIGASRITSDPIYFEPTVQLKVYSSTSRVVFTQR